MEQIKNMLTLRHVAMELATRTIGGYATLNNSVAYDINNHLAIAKGIEKYIKGNVTLPEIDKPTDPWKEIMEKMQSSFQTPAEPKAPNFEVKEESNHEAE